MDSIWNATNSGERWRTSTLANQAFEWNKWCKEIPRLNFKEDWNVKIMPPVCCAIIRFNCEKNGKTADVYLDCYDELGCFGEPYWEIYPYDGDVYRCKMNDTKTLLKAIDEILSSTDKFDYED